MQSIIDAIEQWLKDFLIGAITGNLSSMFSDVNSKVATIATEVGKTPESWNSSVFSIILTLSKNVVVPIAGLVIAAVLTYELISMIIEKNNMHDIDTFMFFKWAFKSAAAAIIVNHTFDFIMAVFQVAQTMVSKQYPTQLLHSRQGILPSPHIRGDGADCLQGTAPPPQGCV